MKVLLYVAIALVGISVAGFLWLAWFLITTPASAFEHQGPGLLGALVMFGSQVIGVVGVGLLVIWKVCMLYRDRKTRLGPYE